MLADCHIHMVLDGENWRAAIGRHREGPDERYIRRTLEVYRDRGFTYLRDGGDKWGVGLRARELAGAYGIRYVTPCAPLCMAGHYGGFIGEKYESLKEFTALVEKQKRLGADFIKLMISGLMDFDHCGVLTEPGLAPQIIRETIHIAKDLGFAVMAHANGPETVLPAVGAGVDSIEHGAYLNRETLEAMAEAKTVWVPTLSAVGNLRGTGRFDEKEVEKILESAMENVNTFASLGGILAPGSDAGAWAVPHGGVTEYDLLEEALGKDCGKLLDRGIQTVEARFSYAG